jgi:hypothetical protein
MTKAVIKKIEQWCIANKMKLNKSKCGILFYSSAKHYKLTKFESRLQDIYDIPVVESYKYLGVFLTKNLNMKL